jgi:hypothetical protein
MVTNIQVENYGKFHQELYLQKKKKSTIMFLDSIYCNQDTFQTVHMKYN